MYWLRGDYSVLRNGETAPQAPLRIIAQILLIQCFYYLSALVSFYLMSLLYGYNFSIDWVVSWKPIEAGNTLGLALFALWLLDSLLCVMFVTVIVERSKLAWDFAVTVHIINVLIVWLYTGQFPTSLLWWCLQILSGVILVTLSTYATRWKELRTVFFDEMLERQELGEVAQPRNSIPLENMTKS